MSNGMIGGLGGPVGFGPVALPRDDDGSHPVALAGVLAQGLALGGQTWTQMWVNTNGTLSFGAPLAGHDAGALAGAPGPVVAAFAADVDTRLRGEGVESGQIWLHEDPAGILTVTWAEVGFFRRNTELVNSFQVRIQAGAGPGDAIFELRYGAIDWVSGDLEGGSGGLGGAAALAGVQPGGGAAFVPIAPSGNEAAWLALGSATGDAAIWTVHVAGGMATVAAGSTSVEPPPDNPPPSDPPPSDPPPDNPPPSDPPPSDPPPVYPPPGDPGPGDPPPVASLTGTVRTRIGAPLEGVEVALVNGAGPVAVSHTDADGVYVLPAPVDAGLSLAAFANGLAAPPLSALDALNILKIVVQMTPVATLGLTDLIAADYDGDGQITALDALKVLQHVVQFADAIAPRFVFVEADAELPSAELASVPLPQSFPGTDLSAFADGGTLDLTAILSGALSGQI